MVYDFQAAANEAEQKILNATAYAEHRGDVAVASAILAHAFAMREIGMAMQALVSVQQMAWKT